MDDPDAAVVAKVALLCVSGVGGTNKDAHLGAHIFSQRPHGLGGEDGRGAKGGSRLLLAVEAVAAVDGQGFGGGGVEGDAAALALDFGVHGGGGDNEMVVFCVDVEESRLGYHLLRCLRRRKVRHHQRAWVACSSSSAKWIGRSSMYICFFFIIPPPTNTASQDIGPVNSRDFMSDGGGSIEHRDSGASSEPKRLHKAEAVRHLRPDDQGRSGRRALRKRKLRKPNYLRQRG